MNANDLYECANRKCRHQYKHKDTKYVKERLRPGPKTLPKWVGVCPKCGNETFYIIKEKK